MTTDKRLGSPTWHNWADSGQPSLAVIEAVAAATDRDVLELPSLSRAVDPDALNSLLVPDGVREDGGGNTVHVSFEYAGVVVLVDSTGLIEIRDDIPGEE